MPSLRIIIAVALALLALASCNEARQQAGSESPVSVETAQATPSTDPAEPEQLPASAEELPAHLGYCVEFCSSCGDSRGENTTPPRDEPVRLNVIFTGVHHNPDTDANMSELDFEMVGVWRNRERMRTQMTMDDRLQEKFPLVELGPCSLHVEPLLSEVVETAVRPRAANDYRTYGAYKVVVMDPDGKLVGEFPLDGHGEAGEAQWQNTQQSLYHVGKAYRRDTDQWRFDVRRMEQFRELEYEAPVLFGLSFQGEGTTTHSDKGPDNALHEYRFPAVAIEFYTPEAIRAAGLSAMQREHAERDVKYAMADSTPLEPAFVRLGIGGGNALPPADPGNAGVGCGGGG